jgi:hypothetical protein
MISGARLSLLAIAFASSACAVHFQAGTGTPSSGGSTWNGPSPAPAPAPAPPPNRTPILSQPVPQTPTTVTILHPLPTGAVTRESVPVSWVRGVFGGPKGALRGLVYYIPNDTMVLPDVSFMKPQAIVYTDELNIDTRDYTEPVAGSGRYEFYAVQYTGTWTASKAGTYQFTLNSSDGSRLIIDDHLVVNDDGRHLPKSATGSINLTAGQHTIRVDYFKAFRWVVALQLFVTPPGGPAQVWHANL